MKVNEYVVYKHTTPVGKIYIGITSQSLERRCRKGKGYSRNPYFSRAIKKYGWNNIQHEILFKELTKEEAEQKEIELIAKYDTTNNLKGYNVEPGGNATKHLSENTKRMISEKAKKRFANKENHPMYGKHISEYTRRRISETNKGNQYFKGHHLSDELKQRLKESTKNQKGKNHPMYGKRHKKEQKEKWSKSRKRGLNARAIKVKCIETNEVFDCFVDAGEKYKICPNNIGLVCSGKRKTAGGLHWTYHISEAKVYEYLGRQNESK